MTTIELIPPSNPLSSEVFSPIKYKQSLIGLPNTGFIRESTLLTGFMSLANNPQIAANSELNVTYVLTNTGKESLQFVISPSTIDSPDVRLKNSKLAQ